MTSNSKIKCSHSLLGKLDESQNRNHLTILFVKAALVDILYRIDFYFKLINWRSTSYSASWKAVLLLKTHIHDKWVHGTETKISSPIPDFTSLRYIAECGLSGSNGQVHNFKIWTVASDLPWTLNRDWLPIEPALFAFSKTAHGKELGESSLKW